MRRFHSLLFLLAVAFAANSQTVKGVITDSVSGEAVPFANVMLEGTRHGVATDINGFYLINKIPEGTYTLLVRFVGYGDYRDTFTVKRGQTLTRNIALRAKSQTLKAVVVSDNRAEERKMQTQVSVEKISAAQIHQMPSIGGTADLAQYLQVLPGINSTGDQGGQLYIRGGSMIQNLCLLDGMIIYNPFHSIGLYSVFETDIIRNADIYSAGFGAEYGGRLSSVMDITTRDGNRKRHSGKIGVNTFGANILVEGPLKKETVNSPSSITYLFSAKNSFLSKTSSALYPYIKGGLPFDYLDLYGKLSLNSGSGSKVSLFGFRFDDQVTGYQALSNYHWKNWGAGANFTAVTGSSSILEGHIAYSDYKINLDDISRLEKYSRINGFNMGIDVTNYIGSNRLKYGVSMEGYSTDYQFYNAYGIHSEQNENTMNISAYITYKVKAGKWLIDPGLRYVYYTSLSTGSLEPRIQAKFNATDKFRLKMAGGLYSQIFLDARSDNDIVNLFSGFLTGSGALDKPATFQGKKVSDCVQKAQHLVFGVEYDFIEHLTANAEVYLKNFSQLLNNNRNKMYDASDRAYTDPTSPYYKEEYYLTDYIIEKGLAYGLDMSLSYDIDWLYLWATYSLGWVTRTDEIQTYSPHYDRRHTVNLLATVRLGEAHQWELSGRWNYGSGYPYTQTQGMYENLTFADGILTDYTRINGEYGVHYAELYAGRLPNYHRLDISAKRKFSLGKHSILEVNLSVTNVYNRNNIFYFDRLTFTRIDQLPILWSLGLTFRY